MHFSHYQHAQRTQYSIETSGSRLDGLQKSPFTMEGTYSKYYISILFTLLILRTLYQDTYL